MEPAAYCSAALTRVHDWVPEGADQAAIAVLLFQFARSRPSNELFLESLRALARDPANPSLAQAARSIFAHWRQTLEAAAHQTEPLALRAEDQAEASRPSPSQEEARTRSDSVARGQSERRGGD